VNERVDEGVGVRWKFGPGLVAITGAMLLLGSAFYCRLEGVIYGNAGPDALTAWAWAFQVSASWIVVVAVVISSRTQLVRLDSRAVLLLCVAAVLVTSIGEWLLGLALYAAGLFDNVRSMREIFYERTPVAAAGVALIVLVCRHISVPRGALLQRRSMDMVLNAGGMSTLQVLTATGRCTVSLADIERFTANENYVQVHHVSGRSYLLRTTMGNLARTLDAAQFVRVHRSVIVSRSKIVEHRRGDQLLLASGEVVRIGRSYRGSV
jgi:hypothetical protein